MTLLENSLDFSYTPTYEGSGQVVHPSVIDFRIEFGLTGWSGYRYWMGITPAPNGDDAYENPSLLASNDGLAWHTPFGLPNPIDVQPLSLYSKPPSHNSDTELIFDPYAGCLILFWRQTIGGVADIIWRTRIYENRTVEPKVQCIYRQLKAAEDLVMSPTVWKKDFNQWLLWSCNGKGIYLQFSSDGIRWGARQLCTLVPNNTLTDYYPWHLQAKPNYREGRIEFLICGYTPPDNAGRGLWYAEAKMANPFILSEPLEDFLLKPSINPAAWDSDRIYRSSFTINPIGTTYCHRVWYSARSKTGQWHLGYTEGTLT